jgi:ATP-dependent protease ClpP protease subunit
VREGFKLYSYLRSFPVPVSAEAVTQWLSMAMVLLMAGDFRFALAETEFLNHPTNSARETLPQVINCIHFAGPGRKVR